MQVALSHVTHYQYDQPVRLGPHTVRLHPAPHARAQVLSYALNIHPQPQEMHWQQDTCGNHIALLFFAQPTTELKLTVDLVAELVTCNPFDFLLEPYAATWPLNYGPAYAAHLSPYLVPQPATPKLSDYLAGLRPGPQPTVDFVVALNQKLHADIRYLVRMEPGVQTPEDTLSLRSGSCRDSAWLMVQLLRHCGLAARFASGYLVQFQEDDRVIHSHSASGPNFNDLHAWCEVFLPGAGWIGLDPTSGLLTAQNHIPLACTPEPPQAAPVEGSVEPCEVDFSHHMSIRRVT